MRDRSWRRSQRDRIRSARRSFVSNAWATSAEYVDRVWRRWGKTNPGTQCSCEFCTFPRRLEKIATSDVWDGWV